MLPKNSRRPLTLDHKIRLKKQLAKAYKSAGIEATAPKIAETNKRVHQSFKPRPEDKIIRKRQSEEDARDQIREVNISSVKCFINILYMIYYSFSIILYDTPFHYIRTRINYSRTARKNALKVSKSVVNRIKS